MKIQRYVNVLISLALLLGLLAGCAQPTATPTEPAPPPTQPPAPTQTATQAPTSAPTEPPLVPITYPSFADKFGVDLGDTYWAYVNIGWRERPWELPDRDGCPDTPEACVPLDENGWPMADGDKVVFDLRPWGGWWPIGGFEGCRQCSPDGSYYPMIQGEYTISVKGKIGFVFSAEGQVTIGELKYDEASNTTTFTVTLGKNAGLLYLGFRDTQRTPDAALNTGFTDMRITLPGYPHDSDKVFTDEYLAALAPFDTLRFMNQIGGNNIDPGFDAEDNTLDWAERLKCYTPEWLPGREGSMCWEWVVGMANLSGKNIWINIPIHASDDYIRGLAEFLKEKLHSGARIYVEYSNEVWNSLFSQYAYNKAAAEAEVAAGNSNLNNDGSTDSDDWLSRRFIRRTKEIADIFGEVFGKQALNDQVRVIFSWFLLQPAQSNRMLDWFKSTYGAPNQWFYALANAGYFNPDRDLREITNPLPNLNVFFNSMEQGLRDGAKYRVDNANIARNYGLQYVLYESGPDNSGQLQWERKTELMDLFIEGHLDPRMGALVIYDMYNYFWAHPDIQGDMYIYFTLLSPWSRWGLWGATRDIKDLSLPKYQALAFLAGQAKIPPPIPLNLQLEVGKDSNTLSWDAAYGAETYVVYRRMTNTEFEPYAEVNQTSFVDAGLFNPNSYYYAVASRNSYGESQLSRTMSGAYPQKPTPTPRPPIEPVLAKYTTTAPLLDGVIDEVWLTAEPKVMANQLSGTIDSPADLSGQVRVLWDENFLYVLFEVTDDIAHEDIVLADNRWDDDSAEVYIDGDNAKSDAYDGNDEQLVFRINETTVWAQRGRSSGSEYISAITPTGWIVEIKIPLAKFGIIAAEGTVFGFEVAVNEDDDGGGRDAKISAFMKTDDGWSKPSVFGECKLVK